MIPLGDGEGIGCFDGNVLASYLEHISIGTERVGDKILCGVMSQHVRGSVIDVYPA